MLWEVTVLPRRDELDLEGQRLTAEFSRAGLPVTSPIGTGRVYLFAGEMRSADFQRFTRELLVDDPVESLQIRRADESSTQFDGFFVTILPKPGVMDPVAETVSQTLRRSNLPRMQVRTGRRFFFPATWSPQACKQVAASRLANDAIEEVLVGPLPRSAWAPAGSSYTLRRTEVPLRQLSDDQLLAVSQKGQLALSLEEMKAIQAHFVDLHREPTDAELETIAQTWSEHCSHKTLRGRIRYRGPEGERLFQNLLKETIFAATEQIRREAGANDWCVSVFADNAGVVKFDDRYHVCFKVETHNHPSAIEPYGGANTGLGGVIRDILGTGRGAKPICNTDVFCFAEPKGQQLPPGVLEPTRVIHGVVAGVRDYGNRMGIPTVNGAVCFDDRYLANPLVYCGTVGLLPVGLETKKVSPGDLIVALGGRTGRDGIHGATFSSIELSEASEQTSGGAVQIGNPITQKKLHDVLLMARDLNLYSAVTDCGAGGFSSAIGEMAAETGADVNLDLAPLKYSGLSYTEIWISEAQERMVLAVPPEHWEELRTLCAAEDVEATALGQFTVTGRLRLFFERELVADLDLRFLHEGRPPVMREAVFTLPARPASTAAPKVHSGNGSARPPLSSPPGPASSSLGALNSTVLDLLALANIRSKEWIIRQYDHEVQGGTVVKPLVGVREEGPGDAAVVTPVLGSNRGIAIGCGINPSYGDHDPYWMAASVIDEALRNVVAVGADPVRVAILDNFCWGNTDRPDQLGSLVRAAEGCRDAAVAFSAPFISGKDSLKNEFRAGDLHLVIPPTLLISALGLVPDVSRCVTMDLKRPGRGLYLLGTTANELGGSALHRLRGITGGQVPQVDFTLAPRLLKVLHQAIRNGFIAACHDLSEGGLGVALAEMCLAGDLGAVINLSAVQTRSSEDLTPEALLFSESNSRFLLEVPLEWERGLAQLMEGLPLVLLGRTTEQPRLTIFASDPAGLVVDLPVAELRRAWRGAAA